MFRLGFTPPMFVQDRGKGKGNNGGEYRNVVRNILHKKTPLFFYIAASGRELNLDRCTAKTDIQNKSQPFNGWHSMNEKFAGD
jgi:hypothetical protein